MGEDEQDGQDRQGGPDPTDTTDQGPFDAVAAVAELEAAMAAADAQGRDPGDSDRYIAMLEDEVLELNTLVEARDTQLSRARERIDRAQEEVEKAKSRIEAEAARKVELRTREVLVSFVEVLDELDRALTALEGGDHPELLAGLQGVHRRFVTALQSHGVRRCPAMGQPFDPELHEALTTTSTADPEQDGRVIAVMREGYTVGDALLRPASVVVGKLP